MPLDPAAQAQQIRDATDLFRTQGPFWPAFVDTIAAFSVMSHFDGFQRGVVDSRDLLFFLSVIGFALFATGVILRNHRAG